MKMKWTDLAKDKMKELSISQERLGELIGKTQGAVGHWLNGRREPSIEDISQIMKVLGITEIVLLDDGYVRRIDELEGDNFTYLGPDKRTTKYPLISWVSAGAWREAMEPYTIKDIDEWYESDAHVEGEAFWLRVEGDSMTSISGLSIPENTLVLFDTGREARNGSLVIAKLEDANEATFKKLIIDGGQRYLKGLNPAWPLMPINGNCRIIGVAIETKMRLI
jgi:SOS-response transcriptional repressor LexA